MQKSTIFTPCRPLFFNGLGGVADKRSVRTTQDDWSDPYNVALL